MIFTDKFIYVHGSKTGGTFVTCTLFRLHGMEDWERMANLGSLLRQEISYTGKYGTIVHGRYKHAGCSEIPVAQRHKPILATVRNPYDLYVSHYEFGWWWKRTDHSRYPRAVPRFTEKYGHFPNISFDEFVQLANEAFHSFPVTQSSVEANLGVVTEQFVKFYFRDPSEAFARLQRTFSGGGDDDYVSSGKFRADMCNIRFIRMDHLNQELHQFLLEMGYEEQDLAFILEEKKILPKGKGRQEEQKWEKYYTPELKQVVREKERFMFELFPEFDI